MRCDAGLVSVFSMASARLAAEASTSTSRKGTSGRSAACLHINHESSIDSGFDLGLLRRHLWPAAAQPGALAGYHYALGSKSSVKPMKNNRPRCMSP